MGMQNTLRTRNGLACWCVIAGTVQLPTRQAPYKPSSCCSSIAASCAQLHIDGSAT